MKGSIGEMGEGSIGKGRGIGVGVGTGEMGMGSIGVGGGCYVVTNISLDLGLEYSMLYMT